MSISASAERDAGITSLLLVSTATGRRNRPNSSACTRAAISLPHDQPAVPSSTVTTAGGEPAALPVLRANRIHRACHLLAGRHTLEFTYHSPTFARAVWITLAAWAAAGLAVVLSGRVSPPGWHERASRISTAAP